MSHFTVLVIGDNVDEQLAPYNEQPQDDDPFVDGHWYVEGDDDTTYYGDTSEEAVDACQDANASVVHGPYFTNPNAKWDWYQIGGRWSGFFKAKEGATTAVLGERSFLDRSPKKKGRCDQAQKKDIDFEGMAKTASEAAKLRYETAMVLFGEVEEITPWKDFIKRVDAKELTIDKARELYGAQPRMEIARTYMKEKPEDQVELFSSWNIGDSVESYQKTLKQYINDAVFNNISTYAVVKDGEWYAKGEMGWFGISTDEVDPQEYKEQYMKMLRELPDDTLLTVVDCHI